jgi:hypothetical protein
MVNVLEAASAPRIRVKFLLWPVIVALMVLVLWITVLAIPGAWLFVALATADFSGVTATIVTLIGTATILGFWRWNKVAGVAMATSLLTVVVMTLAPTPAQSLARWASNWVQLAYYRSALIGQLREQRLCRASPAVAVIAVDGFGSMTSGLALDPTGELSLPAGRRSRAWNATAGETELGVEGLEVRHIMGDYYAWFHY